MNELSTMRTVNIGLVLALLAGLGVGPVHAQSGPTIPFGEGFGRAMAFSNDDLFVGEPVSSIAPGQVFIFRQDGAGGWEEQARLVPSDGEPGDQFGISLAAGEDLAVVGAFLHRDQEGTAYVFERDAGGQWVEQQKLEAGDGGGGDRFGQTVALDGDRLLVGAPFQNGRQGAVYVFERDAGGQWVQQAKLTASDPEASDALGSAVALQGDWAFAAAPIKSGQRGAVYAFERDADGQWIEQQKLEASDGVQGMRFGQSIVFAEDVGFVGAPSAETGWVYVFRWDAAKESWVFQEKLVPAGAGSNIWFGYSVAFRGERVLAGALFGGTGGGAATVYEQNAGEQWIEQATLVPAESEDGDQFGRTVALADGRAFVSAPADDVGAGAVHVFDRAAPDAWPQQARIIGSDVPIPSITGTRTACAGGHAGPFACQGVDLLAFLATRDAGGARGIGVNDLWGWTDPETGIPYALLGREDGVSFVDLSDSLHPRYVGELPRTDGSFISTWRDVKVYQNYALVVADGAGAQGVQIFDLTQLRAVGDTPVTFEETALYTGLNTAHNIAVNEESGFAYAVGGETCGGGLHMIDIRNPLNPQAAGCFNSSVGRGYTHDAQCVVYQGPDAAYQGREVCFGANEAGVGIADVTNKAAPLEIAAVTYPNATYVHQGWLSEDHRYFFQNDELDELSSPAITNTRTLIWDVADLNAPQLVTEYVGPTTAVDHNLYVHEGFVFESNYTSGLRILDARDVNNPAEVAFFDTVPGTDAPTFGGSWSNYPFFDDGFVIATSREFGLFVLEPAAIQVATGTEEVPEAFALAPAYPNPFNPTTTLTLSLPAAQRVTVMAYDVLGRRVAVLHEGLLGAGTHAVRFEAAGLPGGTYLVRAMGAGVVQTRAVTLVK